MVSSKEFSVLKAPEKYQNDTNKYKLIKLKNELKVLLVQKPKIERKIDDEIVSGDTSASVALCVDVGSFEDPTEVQGLAHFLEHMVGVPILEIFKLDLHLITLNSRFSWDRRSFRVKMNLINSLRIEMAL
jgi:predicted Zn-dependent peptidase